jgi:hypothetical protein
MVAIGEVARVLRGRAYSGARSLGLVTLLLLLREGSLGEVARVLRRRAYSDVRSLGLARDLATPFAPPPARLALTVRPLRDSDIPALLDPHAPGLAKEEAHLRQSRLQLVRAGIPTCYVAVTPAGVPQWLIGPRENARVRAYFRGLFPDLAPGEALLEGAYTPALYRGQGLMPHAMARIAERGGALGARAVITFVEEDNIPSLKGCQRAGFVPFLERRDRWRLLRRRSTFARLPESTPYPWEG